MTFEEMRAVGSEFPHGVDRAWSGGPNIMFAVRYGLRCGGTAEYVFALPDEGLRGAGATDLLRDALRVANADIELAGDSVEPLAVWQ